MNVGIYGATGFLGKNLIKAILDQTDWNVIAIGRNPSKIEQFNIINPRLTILKGDVSSFDDVVRTIQSVDVVYYFVHMMGRKDVDFYQAELQAAHTFASAVNTAGVKRVIYMGGLGDNADSKSKHLHSRHSTGEILRKELQGVIELRASMIIGNGSVAYDIIRSIVHKLPIVLLPRSAETLTQPIALENALEYLIASATLRTSRNVVVDIGGPEVLSYADIYREYAAFAGKKRWLIEIPHISAYVAGKFLDVVTPKIHSRIGAIMAESMSTEMTVVNNNATRLFPQIKPIHIRKAFLHTKSTS